MKTNRLAVLGTVTPGRERYCPVLARHLDEMWPAHPPMYFALPAGRTAPYARLIQSGATAWTGTLLSGLLHLRNVVEADYVFMLLEDHAPLWPCDAPVIERVFDVMQVEDFKCVFFPKYNWPWQSTDNRLDEEKRIIGWRQIDVIEVHGHRFARMPKDFFRYNQCQPAIWYLDYYIEVVQEAIRKGIHDPWRFEAYIMPSQPQHYVSEYKWPSWPNGYLDRGMIDWRAIRLMKMPEARLLRDMLVREHYQGAPLTPGLLYALGECRHYWDVLVGLSLRILRYVGRTI